MSRGELTAARRKALRVLAELHPAPGRSSTQTSRREATVYWQAATWLERRGYASHVGDRLNLTDDGIALARVEGLLQ